MSGYSNHVVPCGHSSSWSQSVAWLPLGPDYYLHMVFFPPDEVPEISGVVSPDDVDFSDLRFRQVIEFIPSSSGSTRGERIRIHTAKNIVFTDIDAKGRIYGIMDLFDPKLIRGRVSLEQE